ncbi:integrase catalytic domain-containing protein [Devosia faecipullorum]|uniref:integrase catalytic domain-containing protein n=1 Tax=Devosia faecipullorum TaxID=2755039 RepID=UPI00187B9EC5|nr:DDE-type integrase/transposase/recombinase [Devosia faecipullorum]MBE7733517.1 DDE-type integrase/transposase/recombinase [Devosia faecipullorum]
MGKGITLKIRTDEVFAFSDGMYRFVRELADSILLLQRHGTGKEIQVAEADLIDQLGRGEVVRLRDRRDRKGRPMVEADEVSPDAKPEDVLRAKTLQFYVRAFDADTSIGLGNAGLNKLIKRKREDAQRKGLTHEFSADTLRRAIQRNGAPGARRLKDFMSKRGRTKRMRLDLTIEDMLTDAVNFYWELRSRDKKDAWAYLTAELKKENAKRKTAGLSKLCPPKDASTLYRRIKASNCKENHARKYSAHEANQAWKGVSTHLDATAPGELVIIDHTVVDTWVLLDDNGIPLGRPTLTVAIDVYSRCIVGFLLSAEPPSIYSMATVIKHVLMPKTYVKTLYPDIQRPYDCWILPNTILIDNDWSHLSGSLRDAGEDIGFELHYSPIHSPGHKAIGEKIFDTLNDFFHKLPAAVPYDVTTMRKARLNPQDEKPVYHRDLEYFLHRFIIDQYHYRLHEGINAVPARRWDEGIERHGREFVDDFGALDQLLGKVDEASISRAGVKYRNMRFHDAELTTEILNDMVRLQPIKSLTTKTYGQVRARVKIKINPADCSKIDVWNEGADPKRYVTLPNVDQTMTRGLSFWAADRVREHAKELDLEYSSEEDRLLARDSLRRAWEELAQLTPRRTGADARRGMAQETPTVIEGVVRFAEAEPSVYGNAQPVELPALTRANSSQKPVSTLRGGEKTKAKMRKALQKRATASEETETAPPPAKPEKGFFLPPAAKAPKRNPYDLDGEWK